MPFDPTPLLERQLGLSRRAIEATLALLASNNTIPFIARYRKEATFGLDEVQIRMISERATYLRELEERRSVILTAIQDGGRLTDALKENILAADSKNSLEDLYLPYKPKKRTRAEIARQKGFEPVAGKILQQPLGGTVVEQLEELAYGRDIIAEMIAEEAEIRGWLRTRYQNEGVVVSRKAKGIQEERTKFESYYNFSESVKTIPSHRYLAIRRGESEKILDCDIFLEEEPHIAWICKKKGLSPQSPYANQLFLAVQDGYRRLLAPSLEREIGNDLKMKSDEAAVNIFAENLRSLLLASPLGGKGVIGIDPGFRTGCKCVVLNATGTMVKHFTIYPTIGPSDRLRAEKELMDAIRHYVPAAIAVGNGTGGRETEIFVQEVIKKSGVSSICVQVNEAGASVYSASKVARDEFPDLDLTVRGAISIGRRLQDPLAELVKIEPKAIGVGQYQHDVSPSLLSDKLNDVVEFCVNHVGVELNTASVSLLSYVAGIGPSLAQKIVNYRKEKGKYGSREALLKVPGLGPKTYEQAAGFLRVRESHNPLDASAVHPERYPLVEWMAKDLGCKVSELIANQELIDRINLKHYLSASVGEATLRDIVAELKKPGRDPRTAFDPPAFRPDVQKMEDLQQGMVLEGVVTNVTAFGAFVDIGVHQDGLVHLRELADHFVKDPALEVKTGDKIKVTVLEVDLSRKRISLSARKQPHRTGRTPNKAFGYHPFGDL